MDIHRIVLEPAILIEKVRNCDKLVQMPGSTSTNLFNRPGTDLAANVLLITDQHLPPAYWRNAPTRADFVLSMIMTTLRGW